MDWKASKCTSKPLISILGVQIVTVYQPRTQKHARKPQGLIRRLNSPTKWLFSSNEVTFFKLKRGPKSDHCLVFDYIPSFKSKKEDFGKKIQKNLYSPPFRSRFSQNVKISVLPPVISISQFQPSKWLKITNSRYYNQSFMHLSQKKSSLLKDDEFSNHSCFIMHNYIFIEWVMDGYEKFFMVFKTTQIEKFSKIYESYIFIPHTRLVFVSMQNIIYFSL